MKRSLWVLVVLLAGSVCARSENPSWWTEGEVIDPGASHDVGANYAPVALGQLKNMALYAREHLEANLPGGAGSTVDALVDGFEPVDGVTYTTPQLDAIQANQYKAINLGQLKAVVKPFYDRLDAAGYDTNGNLLLHGYPASWSHVYPWNPSTAVSENYKPANLGQLKMAFSFDLGDMNQDGLSNDLSDGAGIDSDNPDVDGDGVSNVDELLAGTDPFVADSDSDGYDDDVDAFPLDASRHTLTATSGDTTPPTITLSEPTGVTPL